MKPETFVMCTDDNAMSHLQAQLSIEGLNLNNPRQQLQEEVLGALTQPENIGDSHIKMLVKYPDEYSIDGTLVQKFLRSFYKLLWDKSNPYSQHLKLHLLVGDHTETGFLEVRSNDACTKAQLAPLITPKEPGRDGVSVFVNHLDAASLRRVDIAKFFANYIGHHNQELMDPVFFHDCHNF
jgi:hypothetical protein